MTKNYLDYIPVKNPDMPWRQSDSGIVTVTVTNTGFYNWIAQKFFHRPRQSYIDLDQYGSFVWLLIDGERSVFDISGEVGLRFGKKADPLLDRLVKFFEILKGHGFISWKESAHEHV